MAETETRDQGFVNAHIKTLNSSIGIPGWNSPKLHAFVCSLLLRCMFEVQSFACGSKDLTQCTMSIHSVLVLSTSRMQVCTFWYKLILCESPLFDIVLDN